MRGTQIIRARNLPQCEFLPDRKIGLKGGEITTGRIGRKSIKVSHFLIILLSKDGIHTSYMSKAHIFTKF